VAEDDPTAREIVGGNGDGHAIAKDDADVEAAELAGEVRMDVGSGLGTNQEVSTGKHLFDRTLNLDQILTRHAASAQEPRINDAPRKKQRFVNGWARDHPVLSPQRHRDPPWDPSRAGDPTRAARRAPDPAP